MDFVDLSKTAVSSKWKINDSTCKYVCGYSSENTVQPLCLILPQMSWYIKYFEDGAKNMSFMMEDKNVYAKYNDIWDKIKKLLKLKFTFDPVRDGKYLTAKVKIFNGVNRTTFTDDQVPMERSPYICIPAIDIDSVLKVDQKCYPQAYLEQCKYKLKKRRPVNFIELDIVEEDEDESDN